MPNLETLSFRDIAKMSDEQARSTFEAIRWPNGPTCPRCGGTNASVVQGGRAGLYRCLDCRKAKTADQFSVTVGSIFEDSHIGLSKWLQAFSIMCASKKGVSALQLQRQLELGSYRSAWHMAHRIRHAMESTPSSPLLGGPKKAVEVDETYVGGRSLLLGTGLTSAPP